MLHCIFSLDKWVLVVEKIVMTDSIQNINQSLNKIKVLYKLV